MINEPLLLMKENEVILSDKEMEKLNEEKILIYKDGNVIIKTEKGFYAGYPISILVTPYKQEVLADQLAEDGKYKYQSLLSLEEKEWFRRHFTQSDLKKIVSIFKIIRYSFNYNELHFIENVLNDIPHQFCIKIPKDMMKNMIEDVKYTPKELDLI